MDNNRANFNGAYMIRCRSPLAFLILFFHSFIYAADSNSRIDYGVFLSSENIHRVLCQTDLADYISFGLCCKPIHTIVKTYIRHHLKKSFNIVDEIKIDNLDKVKLILQQMIKIKGDDFVLYSPLKILISNSNDLKIIIEYIMRAPIATRDLSIEYKSPQGSLLGFDQTISGQFEDFIKSQQQLERLAIVAQSNNCLCASFGQVIKNLRSLTSLTLLFPTSSQALEEITKSTSLTYLSIEVVIFPMQLNDLDICQNLRCIELNMRNFPKKILDWLKCLPCIEEVKIVDTIGLPHQEIDELPSFCDNLARRLSFFSFEASFCVTRPMVNKIKKLDAAMVIAAVNKTDDLCLVVKNNFGADQNFSFTFPMKNIKEILSLKLPQNHNILLTIDESITFAKNQNQDARARVCIEANDWSDNLETIIASIKDKTTLALHLKNVTQSEIDAYFIKNILRKNDRNLK